MAARPATASDLDDLTAILIASSDDDPCYPYRFPWRHQYPVQYAEHCRRKCWEYLTTNTVDVYEVSDSRGQKSVVAFSVWDQPKGRHPPTQRSQTWPLWGLFRASPSKKDDDAEEEAQQQQEHHHHHHQHHHQQQARDTAAPRSPTDLTRVPSHPKPFAREDRSKAFRDEGKAAKSRLFDRQYPEGYMFLKILLCHPDRRRRGAGTALVKRGLALAHLHGVNAALFSSPMGLHLYRKLGFHEVGRFEVRVEGDDGEGEGLDIPAMVFPAPVAPAASPVRSRRGSRCAAEVAPVALRKCSTHNALLAQRV